MREAMRFTGRNKNNAEGMRSSLQYSSLRLSATRISGFQIATKHGASGQVIDKVLLQRNNTALFPPFLCKMASSGFGSTVRRALGHCEVFFDAPFGPS
jgi:hypothetical protein